jgi:aryl-alcohol dehydrogenase-like predicted oxidoreductase
MSDMTFRRMGKSGLVVSSVGLGTNNLGMKLDADESRVIVHAALDAGITLFDTSDSYGASEARLGELLASHRDDVIIATKFGSDLGGENGADWNARGARRYVMRAVERSLRHLRTDWIDLYQIHFPDPRTPIVETVCALNDLVRAGKIRYLGHSNFAGWQIADAYWSARQLEASNFVSAQNRYNLLERGIERDVLPALESYGVGLLPYFPLASGMLTGKYRRGEPAPDGSRLKVWRREAALTDEAFDLIEKLEAFAAERGVRILDVALGWLSAQPAVSSVIAGATTPDQLKSNIAAASWKPSASDLIAIDSITTR